MACLTPNNSESWPILPVPTTKTTVTLRLGKTSSLIGLNWNKFLTFLKNWPASKCTPSKPAAIALETPHRIIWPVFVLMKLKIPAPIAKLSGNGQRLHPEFAYLPRKFKIAVSGAKHDRAATQLHDIGLHLVKNDAGEIGFRVLVGGGLGRTPIIGQVIKPFLEKKHLLSYLEAILRIYNLFGRRDNKYKARIKILVKESGMEKFSELVENEWLLIRDNLELDAARIDAIKAQFAPPAYEDRCRARYRLCAAPTREQGFCHLG